MNISFVIIKINQKNNTTDLVKGEGSQGEKEGMGGPEVVPVEVELAHSVQGLHEGSPLLLVTGGTRGNKKKGKARVSGREDEQLVSIDVEETFYLGSGLKMPVAGPVPLHASGSGHPVGARQVGEGRGPRASKGKKVLMWEVKGGRLDLAASQGPSQAGAPQLCSGSPLSARRRSDLSVGSSGSEGNRSISSAGKMAVAEVGGGGVPQVVQEAMCEEVLSGEREGVQRLTREAVLKDVLHGGTKGVQKSRGGVYVDEELGRGDGAQ